MDRQIFRRQQNLPSNFLLQADQWTLESIGIAMLDILGSTTSVARLPCTPTSPLSLNVKVGPGTVYSFQSLESTPIGQRLDGSGGLAADTNTDHKVLKQGLLRDTQTFNCPPLGIAGQSVIYLIEAQFQEADDAGADLNFYNTANPNASITENLPPARRTKCALQLKAGTPATTGSQTCPAADAGWVPVWAVTVAFGATTIGSGNIAAAPSAPFISVGSGGGSTPTPNFTTVTTTYTASAGDLLLADTSGGAFTISLPPAPVADATRIRIKGNFATNNLTVSGNGHNFNFGALGTSSTFLLNHDGVDQTLLFDGTNWRP